MRDEHRPQCSGVSDHGQGDAVEHPEPELDPLRGVGRLPQVLAVGEGHHSASSQRVILDFDAQGGAVYEQEPRCAVDGLPCGRGRRDGDGEGSEDREVLCLCEPQPQIGATQLAGGGVEHQVVSGDRNQGVVVAQRFLVDAESRQQRTRLAAELVDERDEPTQARGSDHRSHRAIVASEQVLCA